MNFDRKANDSPGHRTPKPKYSKQTDLATTMESSSGLLSPVTQRSMTLRSTRPTQEGAIETPQVQLKAPPVKKRRKRNPWTTEEDERLKQLIKQAGLEHVVSTKETDYNFSHVATSLGTGRTAKQCRDRWRNHLRTGIKKGNWTAEEEDLIKDLYQTFGPKWCTMTKLLPGRTDNDIKNKWNSMKRAYERSGESSGEKPPPFACVKDPPAEASTVLGGFASPSFDSMATPRHFDHINDMIDRHDAAEALLNFHPVNASPELSPSHAFSPVTFKTEAEDLTMM